MRQAIDSERESFAVRLVELTEFTGLEQTLRDTVASAAFRRSSSARRSSQDRGGILVQQSVIGVSSLWQIQSAHQVLRRVWLRGRTCSSD